MLPVLRQLSRDAMHNASIMKDDNIALLPFMSVDVLRRPDLLLHGVADFAYRLDVIDHGYAAALGVLGAEFVDAAAVYLQVWTTGGAWVFPYHRVLGYLVPCPF